MAHISAVIITFNEEKNIGRCIDSLQTVADEILVVDSYSTDRTEQICTEKGVRFIQNKFDGHIEQKNFAMSQATHPHILSLDADEALTPDLEESIMRIKGSWETEAYKFNRKTNFCGHWVRYCGWYPDTKIRLWNRDYGHWGGVNPHDKVVLNDGVSLNKLKGDLLHYSFDTIQQHFDQIEFFTDISSQAAFDRGQRSNGLKLIVKPAFKFFRDYILKLGFLDGKTGYIICKNSAYAKRLKYEKLRKLQQYSENQL